VTTRNRPTAPFALACLATTLALTACSPGSPDAGQPDVTAPPTTATTSTPSSTAPPSSQPTAPPTRPSKASGLTLAAAEEFIGYYVSLQNYAYATGDPQYMLAESDRGCLGCKGIGDFVKYSNGKNGGLSGDYLDHLDSVKEIVRGDAGRVGGSAQLHTGAYRERPSPSASPVPRSAGKATLEFTLSPAAGNWVMYEMEINE
jgi:hypothetical protein